MLAGGSITNVCVCASARCVGINAVVILVDFIALHAVRILYRFYVRDIPMY